MNAFMATYFTAGWLVKENKLIDLFIYLFTFHYALIQKKLCWNFYLLQKKTNLFN